MPFDFLLTSLQNIAVLLLQSDSSCKLEAIGWYWTAACEDDSAKLWPGADDN